MVLGESPKTSSHGTIDRFDKLLKKVCDRTHQGTQSTSERPLHRPSRVFGRLFGRETEQPAESQLQALASQMVDNLSPAGDSDVPAGIAFLGQFIDHDLTFDASTALGEVTGDPSEIENFRTPRLELDSVYGSGPEMQPYLYDEGPNKYQLILGTSDDQNAVINALDLQRNRTGRAIIGDARNDENIVISQIHGREFIKLHNDALALILQGGAPTSAAFEKAKEFVRGLYQKRVLTEFLPAIVDASVLDPMMAGFVAGSLPGPIDWRNAPDMPVEFSAAAFRFGHSMIRETYQLNAASAPRGLFDLGGFRPVDAADNVEFNLLFDRVGATFQKARKIDTKLAPTLLSLPPRIASKPSNLAERNLIRGQITFQIPFGEDIADEFFPGAKIPTHPAVTAAGLGKTPLWFYTLAEAEAHGGKLGPVGGTLVAGTILNVLLRERRSIANNAQRARIFSTMNLPFDAMGVRRALEQATTTLPLGPAGGFRRF